MTAAKNSLAGQRILVTRSDEDCEEWAAQLRELGATVVKLPCISTEDIGGTEMKRELETAIADSDWLVFTSRRGVYAFLRLLDGDVAGRLHPELKVAVVGPATAEEARAGVGRVDLVSPGGNAADLADALVARLRGGPAGARILIAVAENAGDQLENTLSRAGAVCRRFSLYRTVPAAAGGKRPFSSLGVDNVYLASPSAVTGLVNQVSLDRSPRIFTIGPATTRAVRAAGLTVAGEARRPGLDGLVEAMQCAN